MLGFLASLAEVVEKWGLFKSYGGNPKLLSCMAEFFQNLGNRILTTKERQLTVSTTLLEALNSVKSVEELGEENDMLYTWVEQLEHKFTKKFGDDSPHAKADILYMSRTQNS